MSSSISDSYSAEASEEVSTSAPDSESDANCKICYKSRPKQHYCQGCRKGICKVCFKKMRAHECTLKQNECFFCRQPFLPPDKRSRPAPIASHRADLEAGSRRPVSWRSPRRDKDTYITACIVVGILVFVGASVGFTFAFIGIDEGEDNDKRDYRRKLFARWPHTVCHWKSIGFEPGPCQSGCEEVEDSCYTNATGLPACSLLMEQGVNGSCRGVPTCCQWTDGPEAVCIGFREAPLKRVECPLYCGTMLVQLTYDGMERTYEQYCQDMPCDTWELEDTCNYDAHDLNKLPARGLSDNVYRAIQSHDVIVEGKYTSLFVLTLFATFCVGILTIVCTTGVVQYIVQCYKNDDNGGGGYEEGHLDQMAHSAPFTYESYSASAETSSEVLDSDSDANCKICYKSRPKRLYCQGCHKGVCKPCFKKMRTHECILKRNECFFCRQPFLPAHKVPKARPSRPATARPSRPRRDLEANTPWIEWCCCSSSKRAMYVRLCAVVSILVFIGTLVGIVFAYIALYKEADSKKQEYKRSMYARWPLATCYWKSVGFQPGPCQSGCEEVEDNCYGNATGLPSCSQLMEQGVNGSCQGVASCCQWTNGAEPACIDFAEAPLKRVKCPTPCGTMEVYLTYDGMERTYGQYCQGDDCTPWELTDLCNYDARDLNKLPIRGTSPNVDRAIHDKNSSVDDALTGYFILMFFGTTICIITIVAITLCSIERILFN